ncbi:MAG: V-type ATP synthase subunit I [Methanomicrobia archaeon]|nr:V-type ATP synthase subunit I [Methanomicrobia archaeon]
MFLPQKMDKILIISTDEYKSKLIKYFHEKGVMQVVTTDLNKDFPLELSKDINSLLAKTERVFETFSLAKEEKTKKEQIGIFLREYLTYREEEKQRFPEFKKFLEEHSREIERVYKHVEDLSAKITKNKETIEYLQSEYELLSKIQFDIDLKYLGRGRFIYICIGKLKEDFVDEEIELYKKGDHVLVVSPMKKLDMVLSKVEVIEIKKIGTPKENMEKIEKKIEYVKSEIYDCEEEIKKIKTEKEKIFTAYHEILKIEKERADIPTRFGRTEKTIAITGYLPQKEVSTVNKEITDLTEGYCHVELLEGDDPPVKLSNPRLIRPFEMLVEMFGTPKYSELDPTFILAPVYIIFYATMLGDVFYGLLQTIFAFLLYRGIGRKSKGMRDFSYILLVCGIATIIAGIIMGSYFGDIFKYGGYRIPFLLNPIENPMVLLKLALIIGIIHLNIGITLGIVNNVINENYKAVLFENVSWYFIQIGGGILIGRFFQWFLFSNTVIYIGIVFALIGVSLVFYDKKGLSFFEFTGFLGDWLSYARILALALATSGIAMTVNIVAKMVYDLPIIGVILALFVFVGGQFFNFVLQALGSFVHSLRLHYVEFFSKFYESGGGKFIPFKMERKVTEVIE